MIEMDYGVPSVGVSFSSDSASVFTSFMTGFSSSVRSWSATLDCSDARAGSVTASSLTGASTACNTIGIDKKTLIMIDYVSNNLAGAEESGLFSFTIALHFIIFVFFQRPLFIYSNFLDLLDLAFKCRNL